jgi:hypothetical protein
MKILYLTAKGKWFDMIEAGIKHEEYREIKPYWIRRLTAWNNAFDPCRDFYAVRLARGGHFHESIPQITVECEEIQIGYGKPEWGAEPNKEYFVIKLGKIINNHQPQIKPL